LPESEFTTMTVTWSELENSSSTGSGLFRYIRMNSIYDPWYTSDSSQPKMKGYAFMENFYAKYTVLACAVTCFISCPATDVDDPTNPKTGGRLCAILAPLATNIYGGIPTTINGWQNARHARYKYMQLSADYPVKMCVKWYGRVEDVEGIGKGQLSSARNTDASSTTNIYSALFTTNPVRVPFVALAIFDTTNYNSGTNYEIQIGWSIKMYVKCSEPFFMNMDQFFGEGLSKKKDPTTVTREQFMKKVSDQMSAKHGMKVDVVDEAPPSEIGSDDEEGDNLSDFLEVDEKND